MTSRLLLHCLPFGTKFQNTGFGNQYEKPEVFQVLRKTQCHLLSSLVNITLKLLYLVATSSPLY